MTECYRRWCCYYPFLRTTAKPRVSIYNFKGRDYDLPHPSSFLDEDIQCKHCGDVRISHSRFHESIALMGRTALKPNSMEQSLFRSPIHVAKPLSNPLFLYEVHQLDHRNESDVGLPLFWRDLREFLDIPPPELEPTRFTGQSHPRPGHYQMNICDDEFGELRSALMVGSRLAATWILEYLLDAPDVFVSDRPYFESLVRTWYTDPCLK